MDKKFITIAGATSEIAKSICNIPKFKKYKIFLIGRNNPEWTNEHSNIEFISCDLRNPLSLGDFFSTIQQQYQCHNSNL